MKSQLLRGSLWVLLAAGLSFVSITAEAESHCPGNSQDMRPRLVAGALLIVPVKINQAGPFDFIVDTGSQLNVIDSALAAQLKLKPEVTVGLVTAATVLKASVVVLDSLETGSLSVAKPLAVVEDLGAIQAADSRIRGVLGENFLAHFDVLIDYPHGLLCLDEAKVLEKDLRGERIPLVSPKHAEYEVPFSDRLVISVSLSDAGFRPILLQLDSGSDGPVLYAGKRDLEQSLLKRAKVQGPEVGEARRAFAVLPSQDMRIGSKIIRSVPFVTPVSASQNIPDREEDGILATVLFERVYINHTNRYVIFDPR